MRKSPLIALLLLLCSPTVNAQNIMNVIAGGGGLVNGPATSVELPLPGSLAQDKNGNLYIVSLQTAAVYKLDGNGQLTVVAGNGLQISRGDGNLAVLGSMNIPTAVAVDPAGNLLISQQANSAIRKVDLAAGVILTVVGTGSDGFGGDNGPATQAHISGPQGVAVDGVGNIFISDSNNSRIRRVDGQTNVITTIAGNGTFGFSGDGGPAAAATISFPTGIAADQFGNVYFADNGNRRVRRIDVNTGIISTVAGNGILASLGDGGLAIQASLANPWAITVDQSENVYISDSSTIRRVDAQTGIITKVAGTGGPGPLGDGGPAVNAALGSPRGVLIDAAGNLLIGDYANNRVRKVNAQTSIISTVAGNGSIGDGGPAKSASLFFPQGVAADNFGNVLIADTNGFLLHSVSPGGVISRIAGQEDTCCSNGDGGPALNALLGGPIAIATDHLNNIYFADAYTSRVRRIDAQTGIISAVAGNGITGFGGDGGAATSASLNFPSAVVFDHSGNLLFTDANNQRIRRVDAITGVITTIAGNGTAGFSGEGVPATSASLNLVAPFDGAGGLAVDALGNLFFADTGNQRIRRVDAVSGLISTVAGTGTTCAFPNGDGGLATNASFCFPEGIAADSLGNIFISDTLSARIRRLDATSGTIATVAGNGNFALSPDGLPATQTSIATPRDVALDSLGNVYVMAANSQRAWKVHFTPSASITGSINDFGPQGVNLTSSPQNLVLSNQGGDSLLITSISASGNFSATNNCANHEVGPETSCNISVTFRPTSAGVFAGSLSILTNDPVNPSAFFALSGTGVVGGAGNLSVTGLMFAPQLIGGKSAAKSATLQNTGTTALNISNIAVGGANETEFVQNNQCPASLKPTASCTVQVTFVPLAPGARNATLVLTDDQGGQVGSQQSVALSGTGIAQSTTPIISVAFNSPNPYFASPLVSGPEMAATAANSLFAAANIWNNLNIGWGVQATNPSWSNLVDSNGNATPVAFSVTGNVIGVDLYDAVSNPDPIRAEYMAFNSSTVPTESTSINWAISGLVANASYDLCAYGTRADVVRSFNMTIGNVTQNVPTQLMSDPAPSGCVYFGGVTADGNGVINGIGTGIGLPVGYVNEANWSGFQLVQVPTIGTASIPVPLTFNPGSNVSKVATFFCPSGTTPCTDPNAHSLKITVPQVLAPFTVTVTAYEVPLAEANGVCENGQTETSDFDCRFKTYFPIQTLANGDVIVPQCIPFSNGNCVFYRVGNAPPFTSYQGPVNEYIAWNNSAYVPSPIYQANNPRLFDDPDDPPYDVDHQFVFDITNYYQPTGEGVGVDPGISGQTKHFNDFVVAYPGVPKTAYTTSWVPPLSSSTAAPFAQGDTMNARFILQPNMLAGVAVTPPNRVGYSVVLDSDNSGCKNFTGVRQATVTLPHWPSDFTYDPVRQIYQLKLTMAYNPGHYKLLIDSPLFPERCATFVVTK